MTTRRHPRLRALALLLAVGAPLAGALTAALLLPWIVGPGLAVEIAAGAPVSAGTPVVTVVDVSEPAALAEVSELDVLRATQDDIDQRVEQLAERHQRSPSEVWLQLEKSGQLEVLEREITEDKVFKFLMEQNEVK